jgi:hypothetical protein
VSEEAFTGIGGGTCGKFPLGRPRGGWEKNNKMQLQEVGCGETDWINLAQERGWWQVIVNAVINLRVP